jgi:hypothetical protein
MRNDGLYASGADAETTMRRVAGKPGDLLAIGRNGQLADSGIGVAREIWAGGGNDQVPSAKAVLDAMLRSEEDDDFFAPVSLDRETLVEAAARKLVKALDLRRRALSAKQAGKGRWRDYMGSLRASEGFELLRDESYFAYDGSEVRLMVVLGCPADALKKGSLAGGTALVRSIPQEMRPGGAKAAKGSVELFCSGEWMFGNGASLTIGADGMIRSLETIAFNMDRVEALKIVCSGWYMAKGRGKEAFA